MLLLGVLQAQAAGQVAAGSFDLLETQVLASSAASVTFSSLSTYAADYQHLQIRVSIKSASTNSQLYLKFNADSGSNYAFHELIGGASYASTSQTRIQAIQLPPTTGFTGGVIDILDPFETTKNKTTRMLSGQAEGVYNQIRLASGLWMNTNAVSSITLEGGVNIAALSRFSLYGIKAA